MIDTTNYKSRSQLMDAMDFEHSLALLPVIKQDIMSTESKIARLELVLKRLYSEKSRVEKSIANFYEKYPEEKTRQEESNANYT